MPNFFWVVLQLVYNDHSYAFLNFFDSNLSMFLSFPILDGEIANFYFHLNSDSMNFREHEDSFHSHLSPILFFLTPSFLQFIFSSNQKGIKIYWREKHLDYFCFHYILNIGVKNKLATANLFCQVFFDEVTLLKNIIFHNKYLFCFMWISIKNFKDTNSEYDSSSNIDTKTILGYLCFWIAITE